MGMGTRGRRQGQEQMWIAHQELAKGPAHPFYQRVNELLEEKKFDEFAEKECAKFYAEKMGRPSLTPGKPTEGYPGEWICNAAPVIGSKASLP